MRYLLNAIFFTASGIFIGAVLLFGLGVAPTLFSEDVGITRTLAGHINALVLYRLHFLLVPAGVAATISGLSLSIIDGRWTAWVAALLTLGGTVLTVWAVFMIFPEIDDLRVAIGSFELDLQEKEELRDRFNLLHQRYGLYLRIATGAVLLGLIFHATHLAQFVKLYLKSRRAEQSGSEESTGIRPESMTGAKE